jgi:hypothetical protein
MDPLLVLSWFRAGATQSQTTSIRGVRITDLRQFAGQPMLMLLRGGVDMEMMSIQWHAHPLKTAP